MRLLFIVPILHTACFPKPPGAVCGVWSLVVCSSTTAHYNICKSAAVTVLWGSR